MLKFSVHRLKVLFYGFSAFNLFWIVFTIITCEYTLQYNHIQSVLGENGRIFFPSQLIPFAIGIAGLVRVLYLLFETMRSSDHTPSLGRTPSMPKRVLSTPHGRGILKILAPPTQTEDEAVPASPTKPDTSIENNDLDEEMVRQPLWWRLLVTYLPWLHPFERWRQWQRDGLPEQNEHGDANTDEKREHATSVLRDVERGDDNPDNGRERLASDSTLEANQREYDSTAR